MSDVILDKEYTPAEYFELIKGKKQKIDNEKLCKIYDNCLELLNKYKITGQVQAMRKLIFHLENIEKEYCLINMGIATFVYKSEIEDFIRHVENRVVKIDELSEYEREIPDEITAIIEKTKDIFDKMYVIFTDYTGETERKVEMHRRATDPILFGAFMSRNKSVVVERFYFLGDWEDEFCDLTLDKMVSEVKTKTGRNIIRTINTPEDINELKMQLDNIKMTEQGFIQQSNVGSKKSNVFKRIYGAIRG